MKQLLVILFVFPSFYCFAQKKKGASKIIYTFSIDTTYRFSFVNDNALNCNYKEVDDTLRVGNLNPVKIFSFSSTIFDNTKIILIDNVRFFAYHVSCMERFCTSGYYNKADSIYTFSSNIEVLNNVKEKIDYYSSLEFVEFKQKVFKETNGVFSFVQ